MCTDASARKRVLHGSEHQAPHTCGKPGTAGAVAPPAPAPAGWAPAAAAAAGAVAAGDWMHSASAMSISLPQTTSSQLGGSGAGLGYNLALAHPHVNLNLSRPPAPSSAGLGQTTSRNHTGMPQASVLLSTGQDASRCKATHWLSLLSIFEKLLHTLMANREHTRVML